MSESSKHIDNSWKGNKGEWSESYVFLRLLDDNVLHNADRYGSKIDDEYCIVNTIIREDKGHKFEFSINNGVVVLFKDNDENTCQFFRRSSIKKQADQLLTELQRKHESSTFSCPEAEAFLKSMGWTTIKEKSSEKADIMVCVNDGRTGAVTTRKLSVKSMIDSGESGKTDKSKPSLINGSEQTYVNYKLIGFGDDMAAQVEHISKSNVVERARLIHGFVESKGVEIACEIESDVYRKNILRCYWRAPEVVGASLFCSCLQKGRHMIDTIAYMKKYDVLKYGEADYDDYENGLRKYLWNSAFGLVPGTPWNGRASADGYLIVGPNGELLNYTVARVTTFEEYLLMHTSWDSPKGKASPKHGQLWKRDGNWYFTLSCKVRYDIKGYKGNNLSCIARNENGDA